MEDIMISKQKKEWIAPQCTVYGDVETLTLNSGYDGGRGGGHDGGLGAPPSCGKTCGGSDCNRSYS